MALALRAWTNTRSIVVMAVVAAMFGVAEIVLAPFNLALVPGVLQFKLGDLFPMALGMLFGPAGAWGVGFGNVIGDFFTGNLALGSVFGFLSTFSVAFVGYTLWTRFPRLTGGGADTASRSRQVASYIVIGVIGAFTSAAILAWGLNVLGLVPYKIISYVLITNYSVGNVVGGILYAVVYPRLKAMGLAWTDVIDIRDNAKPINATVGTVLIVVGAFGAWALCNFVVTGSAVNVVGGIAVVLIFVGAALL